MAKLPPVKGPGDTLYEQYRVKEAFFKLRIGYDRINTSNDLKFCSVLDISNYKDPENVLQFE